MRAGKTSPARAKKPSTAAMVTLGLMGLIGVFQIISAVYFVLDEIGYFNWGWFLWDCLLAIPMSLAVFVVAQVIHRIIKHKWMDFRGWWRWWREFLPW